MSFLIHRHFIPEHLPARNGFPDVAFLGLYNNALPKIDSVFLYDTLHEDILYVPPASFCEAFLR